MDKDNTNKIDESLVEKELYAIKSMLEENKQKGELI